MTEVGSGTTYSSRYRDTNAFSAARLRRVNVSTSSCHGKHARKAPALFINRSSHDLGTPGWSSGALAPPTAALRRSGTRFVGAACASGPCGVQRNAGVTGVPPPPHCKIQHNRCLPQRWVQWGLLTWYRFSSPAKALDFSSSTVSLRKSCRPPPQHMHTMRLHNASTRIGMCKRATHTACGARGGTQRPPSTPRTAPLWLLSSPCETRCWLLAWADPGPAPSTPPPQPHGPTSTRKAVEQARDKCKNTSKLY